MFPIEFKLKTLRTWVAVSIDLPIDHNEALLQLIHLDELRQKSLHHKNQIQQLRQSWHEKYIKMKDIKEEEWDLLYDSIIKEFKEKLRTRLLGSYQVEKLYDNGSMRIRTIDEY